MGEAHGTGYMSHGPWSSRKLGRYGLQYNVAKDSTLTPSLCIRACATPQYTVDG